MIYYDSTSAVGIAANRGRKSASSRESKKVFLMAQGNNIEEVFSGLAEDFSYLADWLPAVYV